MTTSQKFRRVAKTSFCKGRTTCLIWSPLCYWDEFSSVAMSCKSSGKRSESTGNTRISKALGFAECISEVSKSCKILVLQREDHMAHVVLSAIGPNFQVWICPANRVGNDRNRRETKGFGSRCPWLRRSRKFRRVGKSSFCKGGATWPMWSPLCYWAEFPSVHISCESSAKRSESTANSKFWEPLA